MIHRSDLLKRSSAASALFPTEITAKTGTIAAAILLFALNSSVVHAATSNAVASSVTADSGQPILSSLRTPFVASAPTSAGGRFAASLNTKSIQSLGLVRARATDASIATSRAAVWPIPGTILLLALALAKLNTRRGRKTPAPAQGF